MADVTLNITIPDAWVPRVQAAIGASTKAQAERWVKDRLKEAVIGYESQQAYETAQAQVESAIESQRQAVETAQAEADTLSL